eukprot:TRINITY_DN245_c1_g1_i1.p1 TRINITY_DN245_c1_g1~~TRINITY_DN245_c1_g1_i1.p1  ORF type:complete len:170 (-),score=78.31 TRINITY_DN245_c1_g1_i1:52-561(-)
MKSIIIKALLMICLISIVSSIQVEYSLQFQGLLFNAGMNSPEAFDARASTEVITTTIDPVDGVDCVVKTGVGAQGLLKSQIVFKGTTFVQNGTITFGLSSQDHTHVLKFESIYGNCVHSHGNIRGAGVFNVTGGEGQFAGAHGYITTNFLVNTEGHIICDQWALITYNP